MKATRTTPTDCKPVTHTRDYQERALQVKFYDQGKPCPPWTWFTPQCGTPNCLEPSHLTAHAPRRIAYPYGVCIYCGRPGWTKDHILPRNWSGEALRKYVATVPACGECNAIINDSLTWSITERRAIAHLGLRRKHCSTLATVDRTPAELREYGPNLRAVIKRGMADKATISAVFDWPTDPAYDLRAMEHSGISDPYAVGLLGELGQVAS